MHGGAAQSFYAPPPVRGAEYASWTNSSLGRFLLFSTAMTLFMLTAFGLTINASYGEKSGGEVPNPRGPTEQFLLLLVTLFFLAAYYSVPVFAERCGVGVFDANWKPYVHFFRLSFFTAKNAIAMPALFCIGMGFGPNVSNGAQIAGTLFQDLIASTADGDLNRVVGDYFVVDDMFVGLNLTRAIIQTLSEPTSRGSTRAQTRGGQVFHMPTQFSEINYFDRKDALAGPPPPLPKDIIGHYVFAPIFETWRICITRGAVSSICMRENTLIGFQYKQADSTCRRAGALGCLVEPRPQLNPNYRCRQTNAVLGLSAKGQITGLCGRIAIPPHPNLLDEIVQRHTQDGWMLGETMACHCPTDGSSGTDVACPPGLRDTSCKNLAPLFFVNADADDRISKTKEAESLWFKYELAGGVFGGLTVFLILLTMLGDCYVDRYLRAAAKYAT
ncbi:unnamed protein product [Amoebophrya sp. A120]|nr:unnamed protein product [Amoebophrya sp. A120]|eukprot:GSA120T00020999001.1